MGFFSGRVTFARYRVEGRRPRQFGPEHLDRLADHAIGRQRLASADGVEVGWTAGDHILDTRFELAKNVVNDALHFALRIDAQKVPADLLRAYYQTELEALAAANPAYHAVLLFRVENPDVPAAEMAERLAAPLGKPVTAAGVRKALQRAHAKFADLLLDEVASSLEGPTPELLCAELRDLDLLRYRRSALERRQGRGQGTAPYQSGRTPGPA